jgi:hypothetical protein
MKYRLLVGNLKGKDHLKDNVIDRRTLLKWISKKWGVDLVQLAQDTV